MDPVWMVAEWQGRQFRVRVGVLDGLRVVILFVVLPGRWGMRVGLFGFSGVQLVWLVILVVSILEPFLFYLNHRN